MSRLAGDLGIAPNMVARAYRELERADVIETRGRHGSFVAHRDDTTEAAAEAAAGYAEQVRRLGIPAAADGLSLVAEALRLPGTSAT